MKLYFIICIFIIKTVEIFGWDKCNLSDKICKTGQKCFKRGLDAYECRPSCPIGWDCEYLDLKATKKPIQNCGYKCPYGLSCFEVSENIYTCSVKCLVHWKCSKEALSLEHKDIIEPVTKKPFVPLITPEEFFKAAIVAGYREPSPAQYHYLVTQAESAGGITTKRELAMFFTQILWESDGLRAKREYACMNINGCPESYRSGDDLPGKQYYGRGYIQLTWSGNYKTASKDLFNDDRLLRNPDMVADNEEIAWATTFWYWKKYVGTKAGIARGEFGVATDAINGLLECKGPNVHKARLRFKLYAKVLKAFKIDEEPIESGCY